MTIGADLSADSVDSSILEELRHAVGDALEEIIDSYLCDTSRQIETARGALGQDDANSVREIAHQLKSSSASVGAVKLSDLMQRIDAIGASGRVDGSAPLLAEAADNLGQVQAYFAVTSR